jgi:hypothetical protein
MTIEHDQQSRRVSRRQFLGTLSTGAVVSSTTTVLPRDTSAQSFSHPPVLRADRFSRLFLDLEAFAKPSDRLTAALLELGKPKGILDAQDALDEGPVRLITEEALNRVNKNNDSHTAGVTFMGQFMDHDITFDRTSRLGRPTEPQDSPNARTPGFDLDSVYGGGPSVTPDLYWGERGRQPIYFKIGHGGLFEDLPRKRDGTALIADPRNDENLMIAGLHAAFLLFHNNAVDWVAADNRRASTSEVFRQARRLTTWHYQWMILHEFLPLFIGEDMVETILHSRQRFFQPEVLVMPVEFQGAAYRFGHSMVRPSYRANQTGDNGEAFFGMIFDPKGEGQSDPVDLRGGARAKRRFIGWETFFDFGGDETQHMRPNKLIDTKISTPLFNLPLGAIASGDHPTSLPQRNLLRHITWQLPSGQKIAKHIGVKALSRGDLPELKDFRLGLEDSTPLWYYILKEAEVMAKGQHLGPVGGRIVGEVIIGLLQRDRQGFLSEEPRWRPTLPTKGGRVTGDFRMVDFLTFAGVAPENRR